MDRLSFLLLTLALTAQASALCSDACQAECRTSTESQSLQQCYTDRCQCQQIEATTFVFTQAYDDGFAEEVEIEVQSSLPQKEQLAMEVGNLITSTTQGNTLLLNAEAINLQIPPQLSLKSSYFLQSIKANWVIIGVTFALLLVASCFLIDWSVLSKKLKKGDHSSGSKAPYHKLND